jgi:hypothetical protein
MFRIISKKISVFTIISFVALSSLAIAQQPDKQGYKVDGKTVSKKNWKSRCIKKNGKIKDKCHSTDYFLDGKKVSNKTWKSKCIRKNGEIKRECSVSTKYKNGKGKSNYKYVIVKGKDGATFKCVYSDDWSHCLGAEGDIIVSVHDPKKYSDLSLDQCSKHHDGQSIMCPEGLFVKAKSINDLNRSIKDVTRPNQKIKEIDNSKVISK